MTPIWAWALGLLSLMDAPTAPRVRYALDVPGHGGATFVAGHPGAPKPLVIAIHGSWDRPEWLCEMLDRALEGDAWLLCLRGVLRSERPADGARWTVGKPGDSLAELDAAEGELRRRYGAALLPGVAVLAGFSKGAWHVAALGKQHPERFPALLLMEGGHGAMTRATVKAFARTRVRTAFGCGTTSCHRAAIRHCASLVQAGGRCEQAFDARVGHSYNPPFEEMGRTLFRSLLARPH